MSDEQTTIKCFGGGKSKAVKGLRRYLHGKGTFTDEELSKLLFQSSQDGKWCFDAETVDAALKAQQPPQQQSTDELASSDEKLDDTPRRTVMEDPSATDNEPEPEPTPEPSPAPAVFGAMNGVLSNVPQAPTPPVNTARAQSRSSYTIEKNRPEQHGIKRPSSGGLCRAVWDAMDELRAQQNGVIPTSEQVRNLADAKGWNKNNAMIEFYQWRKFNGIVGRTPKAAAVPPAPTQPPWPFPTSAHTETPEETKPEDTASA